MHKKAPSQIFYSVLYLSQHPSPQRRLEKQLLSCARKIFRKATFLEFVLTHSWQWSLSYRNQRKSMDLFLNDRDLSNETVNHCNFNDASLQDMDSTKDIFVGISEISREVLYSWFGLKWFSCVFMSIFHSLSRWLHSNY